MFREKKKVTCEFFPDDLQSTIWDNSNQRKTMVEMIGHSVITHKGWKSFTEGFLILPSCQVYDSSFTSVKDLMFNDMSVFYRNNTLLFQGQFVVLSLQNFSHKGRTLRWISLYNPTEWVGIFINLSSTKTRNLYYILSVLWFS